jgi:hypothetical protein
LAIDQVESQLMELDARLAETAQREPGRHSRVAEVSQ